MISSTLKLNLSIIHDNCYTFMDQQHLQSLRNDYSSIGINRATMADNPFDQFELWFDQALDSGIAEPNGMVIATADGSGLISQRTVLMKDFGPDGFCFFTNYSSKKAQVLEENANISCHFPWLALHRQVAFQGLVSKLDKQASEKYFSSRPRESQIGAWASKQSQVLENREELEQRVQKFSDQFENESVPLPTFWGGYLIKPWRVEFWQGRHSRLHDRIVYSRSSANDKEWQRHRLSP